MVARSQEPCWRLCYWDGSRFRQEEEEGSSGPLLDCEGLLHRGGDCPRLD